MIIECEVCEARVDAEMLCSYEYEYEDEANDRYSFLKCPICDDPILVIEACDDLGNPYRLYPPTGKFLDHTIPEPIRKSYEEASLCFRKAKAFTATALLCRKTIEGVCREHGIINRNLKSALEEMKDKEIIESRFYEWAEALRISGNEAAHDVTAEISKQDAKDILEFTDALLGYLFTFRFKFEEFNQRRKRQKIT